MKTTRKIFVVLTLIVLMPALFYSVYEISTLNETEAMVSQLYERQLDAVLFSVNQYLLDVVSSWATQIENELPAGDVERIIRSQSAIISIVITDTSFSRMRSLPLGMTAAEQTVRKQKETVDRLSRYRTASYRKLEPVFISDSTLMILFIPSSTPSTVIGISVNINQFIGDVVGRKLYDIAGNDFVIAVVRQSTKQMIFSTSAVDVREMSQQRPLWIFPDHALKIRLRGTTIREAASDRFMVNVALIVAMDVLLIAGAWFVFRTIRREMELVAMKSDFVSNVSHELRTPLSLIRMFAETLDMDRVKTEQKKKEYYGIILHETERLTRLINNILNFSRMESHTRKFQWKQTDINAVVRSVLSVYSFQFERSSFTVEQTLDEAVPAIDADEEALAEALHNLVDNAIKYSASEKYLRIVTSSDATHVSITVTDRGIGIPHEHQKKIFDKFYRVSHGLVHTAKGSGLGLTIVKHIVQSHNGTMAIDSVEGKGSTFTLRLPLVRR